jgi:hypothetical protein
VTTDALAHAVHRLSGEVRSMRYELDQLREELGELRTQLYEERAARREALHELYERAVKP